MSINNIQGIGRLKQVLINDKHFNPEKLNEILLNDIYKVLVNYLDLNREDIISRIDVDELGNYVFRLKAKSNKIKIVEILNS